MTAAKLNILIVDDHPTMIEGYKSILISNQPNTNQELNIVTAYNCEAAYKIITTTSKAFDVALLDMILPSYEKEKINSGEEVALLIQKQWPDCKIMMLTSHAEAFILYNLIKKINPEGVLVKSDFTPEELQMAFNSVVNGNTYYSTTAQQSIKQVQIKDYYLDAYNRRIISLLAKGVKTKNLPQHLNISISAIDKRKAQIKDFFEIQKGDDEDIIREATKRGFL
jgi:DNA-binding NarL/FixJ family response regulator